MSTVSRRQRDAGLTRIFVLLLLCLPALAPAQVDNDQDQLQDGSAFAIPDRATVVKLNRARQYAESGRFSEAVRLLGEIVESSDDYFYQPDPKIPVRRSLKSDANKVLSELPAEARESYELQFGEEARTSFDEAIAEGDTSKISDVARRFFHTKAGSEAAYLLGIILMDQGEPLQASFQLKRLAESPLGTAYEPTLSVKLAACYLRVGFTAEAQGVLASLRQTNPDYTLEIDGKPVRLFDASEDPAARLSQILGKGIRDDLDIKTEWTLAGGNAARNGTTAGSVPLLNRRWAVSISTYPQVEHMLAYFRNQSNEDRIPLIPSAQPLAVGKFVITRTLDGLEGIDFSTGKRIWAGALESIDDFGRLAGPNSPLSSAVEQWVQKRLWLDATYGGLSSDGDHVFCVEDLGPVWDAMPSRTTVRANGQIVERLGDGSSLVMRPFNRLASYELATEGKLKWEVGGEPGSLELPYAGSFFLGAPLPIANAIYALVELQGEIRLLVLSAQTGEEIWSQQIGIVHEELDAELRHMSGSSPSYADGILVCPTCNGAIVAVELATRTLLWGFPYAQQNVTYRQQGPFRVATPNNQESTNVNRDRWLNGSAIIAKGMLVTTPIDSEQCFCLNLSSGELAWNLQRDDGLYVGGIHNDGVLIVGRSRIRFVRLQDGQSVWPEGSLALPPKTMPSGRGFLSGNRYYLPLSSMEVVAIDLETGTIVEKKASRQGIVPGNLICYQGSVVAQNSESVECFYQLDELKRHVLAKLAANPQDANALSRQGEILIEELKFPEAASVLRAAYDMKPDHRTRNLLFESMLACLKADFAKYEQELPFLEGIIEQPKQKGDYLQVVAEALQAKGDRVNALRAYLRLVDEVPSDQILDPLQNGLHVHVIPWAAGRIENLLRQCDEASLSACEGIIAERFQKVSAEGSPAGWARFAAIFPSRPESEEMRLKQGSFLLKSVAYQEAELVLLANRRAADGRGADDRAAAPKLSAKSTSLLALVYTTAGKREQAWALMQQLRTTFAAETCHDGSTGADFAQKLQAMADFSQFTSPPAKWPTGRVESTIGTRARRAVNQRLNRAVTARFAIPIPYRGPGDDMLREDLSVDQQDQFLIGTDGLGRERWRVALSETSMTRQFSEAVFRLSYYRQMGHLVLACIGSKLVAIDTLQSPGGETAKILWTEELVDQDFNRNGFFGVSNAREMSMPWGAQRFEMSDQRGNLIGTSTCLTPRYVAFLKGRTLCVVDPHTGKSRWTRSEMEPGSWVFGDEQQIHVQAPNATEVVTFGAEDGEELARHQIGLAGTRIAAWGSKILSWTGNGRQAVLTLEDFQTQERFWQHSFESDSKACLMNHDFIAVMQRTGKVALINLTNGQIELEQTVERDLGLTNIVALRGADRFLLIANHSIDTSNSNFIPRNFAVRGNDVINGVIHGFDWNTKQRVFATKVESMTCMLTHSGQVPVLLLSQNYQQQNAPGNNRGNTMAVIQCIDKRTGKVVYSEHPRETVFHMGVQVDEPQYTVQIHVTAADPQAGGNWVTWTSSITMTDRPDLENEDESAQILINIIKGYKSIHGIQDEISAEPTGGPSAQSIDLPENQETPDKQQGPDKEEKK